MKTAKKNPPLAAEPEPKTFAVKLTALEAQALVTLCRQHSVERGWSNMNSSMPVMTALWTIIEAAPSVDFSRCR